MKTPKEFDYDLWRTPDGRYFMRVKTTGEASEISHEVMKFLRSEEKKLRRELQDILIPTSNNKNAPKVALTMLSLDYVQTDDEVAANWLIDTTDFENEIYTKQLEQEFCKLLTDLQQSTYKHCIMGGMPYVEYAKLVGVHEATVRSAIRLIRKKAKKFFKHTTI